MGLHENSRIVVGLDGSMHDGAVLAAAMTEADRRTATLRVVHAIEITMLDIKALTQNGSRPQAESRRTSRPCVVSSATRSTRPLPVLGVVVPVEFQIERGDPATCLLGAARDADLIVTGTRSTGTGSPLLLGTVSQDIAVHASCPVLLVPPKT